MNVIPHTDRQRYTAIEVSRESGRVRHLILEPGKGVVLNTSSEQVFDLRFKPITGYPSDKAVNHFFEFAKRLGASEEAAECLSLMLPHHKETIMATAKKKVAEEKKPVKKTTTAKEPVVKKAAAKKAPDGWPFDNATGKPLKGKAAPRPAEKPAKPAAKAGEKKPSASAMFQELIMEGKLTDDQIFKKVQAAFGLDDKKRSYVTWYRNHLTKEGKNPPKAK